MGVCVCVCVCVCACVCVRVCESVHVFVNMVSPVQIFYLWYPNSKCNTLIITLQHYSYYCYYRNIINSTNNRYSKASPFTKTLH